MRLVVRPNRMDYESARQLVLTEGSGPEGIVVSVRMGSIPATERMQPLLAALECVFHQLQGSTEIDRDLANALFGLSFHVQGDIDGRISRNIETRDGFLDNEMVRMFLLVESIFEDEAMF